MTLFPPCSCWLEFGVTPERTTFDYVIILDPYCNTSLLALVTNETHKNCNREECKYMYKIAYLVSYYGIMIYEVNFFFQLPN